MTIEHTAWLYNTNVWYVGWPISVKLITLWSNTVHILVSVYWILIMRSSCASHKSQNSKKNNNSSYGTFLVASFPGSHPAFRHLQYEKRSESLEEEVCWLFSVGRVLLGLTELNMAFVGRYFLTHMNVSHLFGLLLLVWPGATVLRDQIIQALTPLFVLQATKSWMRESLGTRLHLWSGKPCTDINMYTI